MRRLDAVLIACAAFGLVVLSEGRSTAGACSDCLQAGAASAALQLPTGTPLAGYGSIARRLLFPDILARREHAFWFKPHDGERDPLMARVVALESSGVRLIWASLDVVAVDRAFTTLLAQRLRAASHPEATLIVSASHTHSGPGAFIDSAVMGFIAVDRQDRVVRDALIESVVSTVQRAIAAMQPARLGVASVTAPPLTTGRLGRDVDSELIVMKIVRSTGAGIALLWNYAIHGTTLGPRNLQFSGDVMGLASHWLEADLSIPVLFVNGAVADVSPRHHGYEGAVTTSHALATAVKTGWDQADASHRAALRIRKRLIRLPAPHLSLRNCIGRWVPPPLTLPLGSVFPQETELIGASLGPAAWVAVPGELQSVLGRVIKRAATQHWRYAFVAGLSNDYLGYFVTTQDYHRSSYVTCANLYGAAAGDEVAQVASRLLVELADDRAAVEPRLRNRRKRNSPKHSPRGSAQVRRPVRPRTGPQYPTQCPEHARDAERS